MVGKKVVDAVTLRCTRNNPNDEYCLMIYHGDRNIKLAEGSNAMSIYQSILDTFKSNREEDCIELHLEPYSYDKLIEGEQTTLYWREEDK